VGEGKLLRRAIEAEKLFSSIILWGTSKYKQKHARTSYREHHQ
jgi:hypothetical protein